MDEMNAKQIIEGGPVLETKRTELLEQIHARFIQERTEGFQHPQTGQYFEPVSQEVAEARWEKVKPTMIQKLAEAGEEMFGPPAGGQPPGSTVPQGRPVPRRPFPRRVMPPGGGPGGPEDMEGPGDVDRVLGRGEKSGFLNPREISQLKDILLLMFVQQTGSELDGGIVKALMDGQELDNSQLGHIMDECRRLTLPASHSAVLNKVHQKLSTPSAPK